MTPSTPLPWHRTYLKPLEVLEATGNYAEEVLREEVFIPRRVFLLNHVNS
jgi:hypothetical protein